MAKKIVRGITDVKTINKQDFDTNNVNDLLSDGQYNYIHRKKGKSEEYHNLTDNIKTISSDNTDLLTVTNNNKTNNTALLSPKHDAQKEQVLGSTRHTLNIQKGANATTQLTIVETNPNMVLEHSNLLTNYGISKSKTGNITKLGLEYTPVESNFDLNNLVNGCIRGDNFVNAPDGESWFFVSAYNGLSVTFQEAQTIDGTKYKTYKRYKGTTGGWGEWREQVGDKSVIDALLAQKQNKLTAMGGISITGDSISLTSLDRYSGDLNNLIYSCQAKPVPEAPNLPAGVYGHGILTVTRIGDVVSQQYHTFSNNLYIRSARYADGAPTWTTWVKVSTTALS